MLHTLRQPDLQVRAGQHESRHGLLTWGAQGLSFERSGQLSGVSESVDFPADELTSLQLSYSAHVETRWLGLFGRRHVFRVHALIRADANRSLAVSAVCDDVEQLLELPALDREGIEVPLDVFEAVVETACALGATLPEHGQSDAGLQLVDTTGLRFSERRAPVEIGGQWGFADPRGVLVVMPRFERVRAFSDGLAAVRLDGRWGFVGREGDLAIDTTFERVGDFEDGTATARTASRRGRIDRTGNWLPAPPTPPWWRRVLRAIPGWAWVTMIVVLITAVTLLIPYVVIQLEASFVTHGRLSCWKDRGAAPTLEEPEPVELAISLGGTRICTVNTSGNVRCWRASGGGELSAPAGDDFTDVVIHEDVEACALDEHGDVTCWRLVDTDEPLRPSGGPFSALAGQDEICGLRDDGTATCWNALDRVLRYAALDGQPLVAIDGSWSHTCGLDTDGDMHCWSDYRPALSYTRPGPFTALDVGENMECALDPAGAIHCWSTDPNYPLGDPPSGTFVALGIHDPYHSCAIDDGGDIHCWGEAHENGPVIHGGDFTRVVARQALTCAIEEPAP